MEQTNVLKSFLINNRYKVEHIIKRGASASVYLGTDKQTKEKVAIKVKSADEPHQFIPHESTVYQKINNQHGFPHMLYSGQEKGFNILVMEKLGVSLDRVFYDLNKHFTMKTVLQLAVQMLSLLETLHELDFIHRALKPGSFMMGSGDKSGQVHLIDFGRATQYRHENQHVPSQPVNVLFVGCPAFASCNVHLYRTMSRRDDLESLGYVLVYFATGTLPWLNHSIDTFAKGYWHIQRTKLATSIEELCQGVPQEFMRYFQYIRELGYDEEPNYGYLRSLFSIIAVRYRYMLDLAFEWNQPNTANV